MAEVKLGSNEALKTLKVIINEKEYAVPLAGSLKVSKLRALRNGDDDGFSLFEDYIPAEVIEDLTMDQFKQLNDAWKQASKEASGVDLGE
jgi:DNA-binding GntR family transcriptional regulator